MQLRTEELVDRARAGDDGAYDSLFERVANRILLYIRLRLGKKLGGQVDAMDVLQEAYLEAHRSFSAFEHRGEDAFLRWMYRIADNRLRDLAKHFGAQKRTAPHGNVRATAVIARIRASQTGPSSVIAREEEHGRLLEAMQALEEDEREVLIRRYFQEQTLDEVARELGRSEPAVRRLVAKAQLKLGRSLRNPERVS